MALSTEDKQALLDAIETAIGQGVRRVKYQDKEVEYPGVDEMMKIRDSLRRQLSQTEQPQRIYAQHSKGL